LFNTSLVNQAPGEIETGLLFEVLFVSPALTMHEVLVPVELRPVRSDGLLPNFERLLGQRPLLNREKPDLATSCLRVCLLIDGA